MAEYTVITIPGISEASSTDGAPVGMMKNFTDLLPERFICEHFNWKNQYGPVPVWNGAAFDQNAAEAIEALKVKADASALPVVLAAYSGGAYVASYCAPLLTNLAGIVAVANPVRKEGDSAAPFYGITGRHDDFEVPLFDLANPADVIPCCPPTQPLRNLYPITRNFSLVDKDSWGNAFYAAVVQGPRSEAFRGASLEDWWQALAYARGYLWDRQHTTAYLPHMAELANAVTLKLT